MLRRSWRSGRPGEHIETSAHRTNDNLIEVAFGFIRGDLFELLIFNSMALTKPIEEQTLQPDSHPGQSAHLSPENAAEPVSGQL
jgi:hypothetical protein